jgi:hypothetical protein
MKHFTFVLIIALCFLSLKGLFGQCTGPLTIHVIGSSTGNNMTTSIITQPTNQTAIIGTSFTLTVVATGTNLSYQWKKDGNNLTAETNASYTKTAAANDAGDYTVVVHGDCGLDVLSNIATVTLSGILPIELVKFQAKPTLDGNWLTWQSSNEINCASFDIEKSTDGSTFKKIKEIQAKGKAADYEYLDSSPLTREWQSLNSITSYYRLKINDFGGEFRYSAILSIALPQNGLTLKAYPNPFGDFLMIDVSTTKKSNLTIEITDMLGRSIFHSKTNVLKFSISSDNLPNGAYFVKVSDGQRVLQQKIVKQ